METTKMVYNRKKSLVKPVHLRVNTFNAVSKLSVRRMIATEEKQTGDSVIQFLLNFYEKYKDLPLPVDQTGISDEAKGYSTI